MKPEKNFHAWWKALLRMSVIFLDCPACIWLLHFGGNSRKGNSTQYESIFCGKWSTSCWGLKSIFSNADSCSFKQGKVVTLPLSFLRRLCKVVTPDCCCGWQQSSEPLKLAFNGWQIWNLKSTSIKQECLLCKMDSCTHTRWQIFESSFVMIICFQSKLGNALSLLQRGLFSNSTLSCCCLFEKVPFFRPPLKKVMGALCHR